MRVALMRDSNPDALLAKVWTAIKVCKSDKTPLELAYEASRKSNVEMTKLLRACYRAEHYSVFEHVSLTFMIEGVSRALLAQFSRHRVGISLSVQSQRYVNMDDIMPIRPKTIATQEQRNAFDDAMLAILGGYEELSKLGVPREDARFLLPNAAPTNMVVTVNLRSLDDLYKKRVLAKGVQWEIKELVESMMEQTVKYLPWYGDCLIDTIKESE